MRDVIRLKTRAERQVTAESEVAGRLKFRHVGTRATIFLSQIPDNQATVLTIAQELGVSRTAVHRMLYYWDPFDIFEEHRFPCPECRREDRYVKLTRKGREFAVRCISKYGEDWKK